MDKQFFVYMMASGKRGTIYTGVASDLVGRVWQHRTLAIADSFTARYGVTQLVWFEEHGDAESAILRANQGVAARVEGRADRGNQSGVG